jgi:hypothetical protein
LCGIESQALDFRVELRPIGGKEFTLTARAGRSGITGATILWIAQGLDHSGNESVRSGEWKCSPLQAGQQAQTTIKVNELDRLLGVVAALSQLHAPGERLDCRLEIEGRSARGFVFRLLLPPQSNVTYARAMWFANGE